MPTFSDIDYMTVADHKVNGDWPLTWLPVKGLLPYIKRSGKDARGIEVGLARAESSYAILESCPNVARLYGIDPYVQYKDWNGEVDQEHNDKTKKLALENMTDFDGRFSLLNMKSSEALAYFRESGEPPFDFIFIDGDHSFEGAKHDFVNYYALVRPGGIFSGHDYNLRTVRMALDQFREENKIRIPVNIVDNQTWFWSKV